MSPVNSSVLSYTILVIVEHFQNKQLQLINATNKEKQESIYHVFSMIQLLIWMK